MAFCTECGHQLAEGAKFCYECGAKVNNSLPSNGEVRRIVYDGELHKCPNCGELLNAFEAICSVCGYELRGSTASSVVHNFANEIKRMEQEGGKNSLARIATFIATFPVPNSREDLLEFLILSSSNISEDRYKKGTSKGKQAISDAWSAKFEQAYQKAILVFAAAPELPQIKEIYEIKTKQIKRNRLHGILGGDNFVLSLLFVGLFVVMVLIILTLPRM